MNYELAKQLKEAGYPQNPIWECEECKNPDCPIRQKYKNEVHIPSLSELVKACGEDLRSISRWKANSSADTWQVMGERGVVKYHYLGSTPEIAVARFWLALNNK